MTKRFKEGDTVQQKHGGPQMTVSGYNARGEVICILSNGKKFPLPQAVLRLYTPSKVDRSLTSIPGQSLASPSDAA